MGIIFGSSVKTEVLATLARNEFKFLTGKSAIFEVETGIKVAIDFDIAKDDPSSISLGTHQVSMNHEKTCSSPGLWLRIEGDALMTIVLYEQSEGLWQGSFEMPVAGKYALVAYWYGCDGESTLRHKMLLMNVTAKGEVSKYFISRSFFPSAAWLSSKNFTISKEITQPYVWHNPQIPSSEAQILKTSHSFVTKDSATYSDTGYYQFKKLSNYELVCWVGGDSADLLHASFQQLRSLVNSHQRPFKFHIYESKSLQNPDATWTEGTKQKFRKCKHILVSMDQLEVPLTQSEYLEQMKNFIGHLLKAFPDDTFPIWIFTGMEPPYNPTNCLHPTMPRSSHHPCNIALQELFHDSPFPERVRFMDASDISLPQLGENPRDVATATALRIFVFVGQQVAEWRANNQVGNIKGLQRGDTLIPNFELVPYLDWGK